MTCLDCRYYAYIDEKPMCKRYPPVPLAHMMTFNGGTQNVQIIVDFPTLNRTIACGEWRAKDEPV